MTGGRYKEFQASLSFRYMHSLRSTEYPPLALHAQCVTHYFAPDFGSFGLASQTKWLSRVLVLDEPTRCSASSVSAWYGDIPMRSLKLSAKPPLEMKEYTS